MERAKTLPLLSLTTKFENRLKLSLLGYGMSVKMMTQHYLGGKNSGVRMRTPRALHGQFNICNGLRLFLTQKAAILSLYTL